MTSSISDKETYRELCETEGDRIPLFQQYWWMETVCTGKHWDVALARAKDGTVTGALPYLMGSKFGLRYILQPQLTQYNGPWYRYPDGLPVRKRIQFQYDVDEQLIAAIKKLKPAFYSQNFPPAATNWLPWHWAGYHQTTRYSYRIDDISNPQQVFDGFRKRDRQTRINSLMPQLEVVDNIAPSDFAQMHQRYLREIGKHSVVGIELVENVCRRSVERGQGLIVGLREKSSAKLLGATFAVYDSQCAYSLMAALDRKAVGVSECLFWTAILSLSGRTKAFDFEGSMQKSIEYLYRSFGAEPVTYHHIWKTRSRLLSLILSNRI